jgi:endonuclease/exonuclease/phosphatase family metal-dependent hydrolase
MRRSAGSPQRTRSAVVVALALGAGALAGTGPVTSAGGAVRLVQFNLCGNACTADDADKVGAVVAAVTGFRPDAVSLDEVCRPQLNEIREGIGDRGWAMSGRFMVTKPHGCRGPVDYGIAVMTRAAIVDADHVTYVAQSAGTPERRGLLCVRADVGGRPTRVCTTHIVAGDEDRTGDLRRRQIASAALRLSTYPTPVVLMGDFNRRPTEPAMGALYAPSHRRAGHGVFDEVDQGAGACRCGAGTLHSGAKVDYIFVTARDFEVLDAAVVPVTFSDHDLLRGRVMDR